MIYLERCQVGRAAINSKVLGGIVGALLLLVILIVLCFFNGQLVVDIVLIVVAFFSLVAFALLGYAAIQIIGLVKEVRGEVQTVISTAQETMTEVRGTAQFVSETVVHPVSQAAAFVSAVRATAKAFTEPLYKRRS